MSNRDPYSDCCTDFSIRGSTLSFQSAAFYTSGLISGLRKKVANVESYTLTTGVQGIDSQESEVSQVIDTQKIADLPISGRDFIDFVLLTPSAAGKHFWASARGASPGRKVLQGTPPRPVTRITTQCDAGHGISTNCGF